ESRIVLGLNDPMHARDSDEASAPPLLDPMFHPRDHVRDLYRVHTDTQHAKTEGPCCTSCLFCGDHHDLYAAGF
ncbi:MAG: hypothetical protein HY204_00475, partial [Nitrospirae bacterium]|nr:hypothetical protein [Nitrospirota bacterium]